MSIRFDGRVALVTGAGNGLGRAHAMALAARGARVIVNDLGGMIDGGGGSPAVAQEVVDEIIAAGGEAVANGDDITEETAAARIVDLAQSAFGRLDIVVNNAGILRDKSFGKMTVEAFDAVVNVHLRGAFLITRAAWPLMRAQNYGRVAFTTSPSGLYGNFGQANYSAAKLALVGLMNTLHLEGAKYDIRVNCLAPTATTRLLGTVGLPEEAMQKLSPDSVTPGLLYLVSEDAPSRTILSAAGGCFTTTRLVETQGVRLPGDSWTPEAVAARFDDITDTSTEHEFTQAGQQTMRFLQRAGEGAE